MATKKRNETQVEELDDEALEQASGGFEFTPETKKLGGGAAPSTHTQVGAPTAGGQVTLPVQPKTIGSKR